MLLAESPSGKAASRLVLEYQGSVSAGRLAQNPILANLAGLNGGGGTSSLETEVKILESPSLLKPIYEFVKSSKASAGEDISKWAYTDWAANNLSIKLVKGTSVLNLSYQDTDKSLLLPVLERITKTYQEYSNRDSAKSINNALKFAGEQSDILRAKAKDSNRKFDSFKLTHGISDDAGDVNLPQLNKLSYPLPQASKGRDPLAELAAINKELTRQRQFFTDADPSVQRLQKNVKPFFNTSTKRVEG